MTSPRIPHKVGNMADFNQSFWSIFVVVMTSVSVLGCGVFLYFLSRAKVQMKDGKVETTGHVWDENLAEYNNPLPRWWMILFYLTIVFSVIYLTLFPGLGDARGSLGWSSAGQYEKEVSAAQAEFGPIYAQYAARPIEEVAKDEAALKIGQRIFVNNCAQCHGTDARGGKGFPNLTDGEWLYGGDAMAIKTGILEGRMGMMPPMADALGGESGVENVANYVLSLSGSPHDATKASLGKAQFVACAACHGENARGMTAMGAPNLTDKVWLYGGSLATISETINKGRGGVMPAWKDTLGEERVHLVAAYVYSLSHR